MCILLALAIIAISPAHDPQLGTTGRVIVTVTTLEGAVHMPGVQVELRDAAAAIVIARSVTDGTGQVTFPDVAPGEYIVIASRPGFVTRETAPFTVGAGASARVLIDTPLTFELPQVEVRATAPSPTDSVQPVSMSDMLSGSLLESAPLQGDDFRSLLPLLPGVVRGADGRLRLKGGQPVQSALQISSASLNDPSTGDFDLDLPAQSVQSVEVLANPFAAEYGRFSASITQIRTRRGTNDWRVSTGNLVPRIRGVFKGIRGFEPLFSVRGPLRVDRLFAAADVQFRYVATPVRSLPGEPDMTLRSFDAFTRFDAVVSPRHTVGGALVLFPRRVRRASMNTFRPIETTADVDQKGWAVGVVDRIALARRVVVESTVSIRRFEIHVDPVSDQPMTYAPDSERGGFFNRHEREVTSVQWVEALSFSRNIAGGQHVFKLGADLQRSSYTGESSSRPVEIRRLDGTLAERIDFGGPTAQQVAGTELAVFAQDRWRVSPRVTLEFGLRFDRDPVVERINTSPRAGIAIGVLPEGRGILRGGAGKFVQRTPLNVDAFASLEPRTVARFDAAGALVGLPVHLVNHPDASSLRTPEAVVGNVEWDQRFGRRVLLKIGVLARRGTHEYILEPEPALGRLRLSSTGTSRYRELEMTTRYLGSERRDLTFSYVWSHGTADLNTYDQFFGTLRHPIVRPNASGLIPTDVPHRLLVRGTVGLPGQWDLSPVLELRSGFPWSPVDEYQDFVGARQSGRLPAVRTLDLSIVRPWRVWKYRFRAGVKLYNVLGASAARDVQTNISSPDFGRAFNPVERSVSFVFGSAR